MTAQTEEDQLVSAWRALSGHAGGSGWKAIEISRGPQCAVLAGRRGGGNEESLLIGITNAPIPDAIRLPRSQGFQFIHTEHVGDTPARTWFALVKKPGGQLPMFTLMAADLVVLLNKVGSQEGGAIYTTLVARITAWQQFMKLDRSGILSAEEEVGLVGELVVLQELMDGGVSPSNALEAWVGPEDGLHDFAIGTGAVEAKTTLAPQGFLAEIASLEQLDDSLHRPLYIAAVRLAQQAERGMSLPVLVDTLIERVRGFGVAPMLEGRLLSAGYVDAMRSHYSRAFVTKEITYRLVTDASPCLTRANVPPAIQRVRYAVDLDAFPVVASRFPEIFNSLGTIN
jgi:hypothetical protein